MAFLLYQDFKNLCLAWIGTSFCSSSYTIGFIAFLLYQDLKNPYVVGLEGHSFSLY